MSVIKGAAYYITKNIDNQDIHVATFYDINGNYLVTHNLKTTDHHSTKIHRLDNLLDPKCKNKIILSKVIFEYSFIDSFTGGATKGFTGSLTGDLIIKYCDKNNNVIIKKEYPYNLGINKDNVVNYTNKQPDATIFDKYIINNKLFDIIDNSNKSYCVLC